MNTEPVKLSPEVAAHLERAPRQGRDPDRQLRTATVAELVPGDLLLLQPGAWVQVTSLVRNLTKVTVGLRDGAGTEFTLDPIPAEESGTAILNPTFADVTTLLGSAHVLPVEGAS